MEKIPAWLLQLIAGVLAALLIILSIGQLITLSRKAKNIDQNHTINISAEGKVTAKPDLATIVSSVIAEASTAVKAQDDATIKMNQVVQFVKNQGVDAKDITTSVSVEPRIDWTTGTQRIIGYTGRQSITIKVRKIENAGSIIDGLVQSGANEVQSVYYGFDDPDQIRQQAREEALKNAKEKAQRLADVAGGKLGKLVSFSENSYGYPTPMFAERATIAEDSAKAVPSIEPGTQEITAQVNVVYELK